MAFSSPRRGGARPGRAGRPKGPNGRQGRGGGVATGVNSVLWRVLCFRTERAIVLLCALRPGFRYVPEGTLTWMRDWPSTPQHTTAQQGTALPPPHVPSMAATYPYLGGVPQVLHSTCRDWRHPTGSPRGSSRTIRRRQVGLAAGSGRGSEEWRQRRAEVVRGWGLEARQTRQIQADSGKPGKTEREMETSNLSVCSLPSMPPQVHIPQTCCIRNRWSVRATFGLRRVPVTLCCHKRAVVVSLLHLATVVTCEASVPWPGPPDIQLCDCEVTEVTEFGAVAVAPNRR